MEQQSDRFALLDIQQHSLGRKRVFQKKYTQGFGFCLILKIASKHLLAGQGGSKTTNLTFASNKI